MKLTDTFYSLRDLSNTDLIIQIESYEQCQLEDESDALGQSGFDLNNISDVFNAICIKVQSSDKNHEKFLELLQLLFNIEDGKTNYIHKNKSDQVNEKWMKLNQCAREIIFGKNIDKSLTENSTQTVLIEPVEVDFVKNEFIKLKSSPSGSNLPFFDPNTNDFPTGPPPPIPISPPPPLDHQDSPIPNSPTPPPPIQLENNSSIPSPPPLPIPSIDDNKSAPFEYIPPPPLSFGNIPPPPPSFGGIPPPPPSFGGIPPPPPSFGGIPPPPPSFGGISSVMINSINKTNELSSQQNAIYKSLPKPSKPLKTFSWQKVSASSIGIYFSLSK